MSQWLGHLVLHSMGLVLAVVVAWMLRAAWRRQPGACYRLMVCVLLAALVLPAVQLLVQGRGQAAALPWLERVWWTEAEPSSAGPVASQPRQTDQARLIADAALAATSDVPRLPEPEVSAAPAPAPKDWSDVEAVGLIAAAWALGALLVLRRTISRVIATRRVVRAAVPATDPEVLTVWKSVARTSSIGSRVRLMASPAVASPACWGLGRFVVLVPADPAQRPDKAALRCALLHELVHLERGDTRTALLQAVLCAVFWFHPGAWWLSRQLDTFRELSCDEEVVRRTGRRKKYAEALIACARQMIPSRVAPCPSLIPWSRNGAQLRRRIEMLVANRKAAHPVRRGIALIGAAVALVTLWTGQVAIAATLIPQDVSDEFVTETRDPTRLGIEVETPSAALAAQVGTHRYNLLLVTNVEKRSRAAKAGLKKFDVIHRLNGQRPVSIQRLEAAKKSGSAIRLDIMRGGKQRVITIRGTSARDATDPIVSARRSNDNIRRAIDLLNDALAEGRMSDSASKALRDARRLLQTDRRTAADAWLRARDARTEKRFADANDALLKALRADPRGGDPKTRDSLLDAFRDPRRADPERQDATRQKALQQFMDAIDQAKKKKDQSDARYDKARQQFMEAMKRAQDDAAEKDARSAKARQQFLDALDRARDRKKRDDDTHDARRDFLDAMRKRGGTEDPLIRDSFRKQSRQDLLDTLRDREDRDKKDQQDLLRRLMNQRRRTDPEKQDFDATRRFLRRIQELRDQEENEEEVEEETEEVEPPVLRETEVEEELVEEVEPPVLRETEVEEELVEEVEEVEPPVLRETEIEEVTEEKAEKPSKKASPDKASPKKGTPKKKVKLSE